jgi:hypothetical protein
VSRQATLTVAENGNLLIHIPMFLRRKQGRKLVFTAKTLDKQDSNRSSTVQEPMLQSLTRAFAWTELIESGKVKSITDLAKRLNLDGSYITRIMKLSTLAPDIVLSIINGNEPEGLSISKLFESFPEDWIDQKKKFGF